MEALTHSLARTVFIQARPETVFRYFIDSSRWARWWGAGSTIDARPGGPVKICFPNGIAVSGDVVAVEAPRRIVFTYGYAGGNPIPPGGSRVTIQLEPEAHGTRLLLTHEFADAAVCEEHVQGWRFQLSLFSNAVMDEVNAEAPRLVDAWFAAWALEDGAARERALAEITVDGVRFGDRYSALAGRGDLSAHIAASQRFMPKVRLERRGDVRHCQGIVLADWKAVGTDGSERASGTNVFVLGADGLIESATGFWQ